MNDTVELDASQPRGWVSKLVHRARRDESGLALVWTSMFLLVFLGVAGLAVDLGHAYLVATRAQNAADAAALSGAVYLPASLANAQSDARIIATANGFTNGVNGVTVTAAQGTDSGQLQVTVSQNVPTWFARALGFKTMTVSKTAAADDKKATVTTPVDLMIILDRTGSMSSTDLTNLRTAVKALLTSLSPANTNVALGLLGPSDTSSPCTGSNSGAYGNDDDSGGVWIVSPYPNAAAVNNYQNADGTLNTSSQIVKTINCFTTSGVGTDLGDPVAAAQTWFSSYARVGAKKGLILMTDGAANVPTPASANPCNYANTKATAAKTAGITIVTIGFGVDDDSCVDSSGTYKTNPKPTGLLANMASPINGVAANDNGCTDAENTDGDNFFCQPKSGDLSSVFVTAGNQLTDTTPRLVK